METYGINAMSVNGFGTHRRCNNTYVAKHVPETLEFLLHFDLAHCRLIGLVLRHHSRGRRIRRVLLVDAHVHHGFGHMQRTLVHFASPIKSYLTRYPTNCYSNFNYLCIYIYIYVHTGRGRAKTRALQ